jgi:hypothetical protein
MGEQLYTDVAVELAQILHQLCDSPAKTAADSCLGVARVLVAAGWRPPSATGAVIHPTHGEQVAYDEGYAQGRTAAAEAIADALDEQLKHGAPAMSPAYHSGYRDAARYVRNRGAEAGR